MVQEVSRRRYATRHASGAPADVVLQGNAEQLGVGITVRGRHGRFSLVTRFICQKDKTHLLPHWFASSMNESHTGEQQSVGEPWRGVSVCIDGPCPGEGEDH